MSVVTQVTELRAPSLSFPDLTGERSFLVYFDVFSDYQTMALLARDAVDPNTELAIPQIGSDFGGNVYDEGKSVIDAQSTAVASNIEVGLYEQQNLIWEVTVEFGPNNSNSDGNNTLYPWQEPDQISWGQTSGEEPMIKDLDGKYITNSAGYEFESAITRPIALTTLSVTKKRRNLSRIGQKQAKVNTVNSSSLRAKNRTIPQGQALCTGVTARSAYHVTQEGKLREYWIVTVNWVIKEDGSGWQGEVGDYGYINKFQQKALDKDGAPFAVPQKLDGEGNFINEDGDSGYQSEGGQLEVVETFGDVNILGFKKFAEDNHSSLI